MKKIFKSAALAMLLGGTLQTGYAQNLNKHINNADNVSIDYLLSSNGYVLGGLTHPKDLGGMSNSMNNGYLERIQLEKLDNQLNNIWFKTYATADEVQAVKDGKCQRLSNYFTLGDAKQTKDDGYIICGRVRRDPETSGCGVLSNYDNMFLLKTDKDGVVQWFKRYDRYGMLTSVVETPSGDFITCGYLGGAGTGTGVIIYTDPGGNLSWSKEAQTPAYWDHSVIIGSLYSEVVNFNGNFALVGMANTMGTVWGGTLITVIDASGSYIQNAIIDNEPYQYTLAPRAIANAADGDVVITGMAGAACQQGAQVFILKIEPISMSVNFLRIYSYNNFNDISWGNSISTDNGKRIFVTGIDPVTGPKGALYLETDYSGNVSRYTVLDPKNGGPGKSITYNSYQAIPAFSGQHSLSYEPTFVIKDDMGYDCDPDMYMPDYTTPYDIYSSYDRDPGIKHIDDKALDFDLSPAEEILCGSSIVAAKGNAATAIKDVTKNEMTLSPNPASDYIDLDMHSTAFTGGTLKVYDVTGRVLINRTMNKEGHVRVNTASLQPGMYTINVEQTDGAMTRSNFIKN